MQAELPCQIAGQPGPLRSGTMPSQRTDFCFQTWNEAGVRLSGNIGGDGRRFMAGSVSFPLGWRESLALVRAGSGGAERPSLCNFDRDENLVAKAAVHICLGYSSNCDQTWLSRVLTS